MAVYAYLVLCLADRGQMFEIFVKKEISPIRRVSIAMI